MQNDLISRSALRRHIIAFATGCHAAYLTIENIVMMINQADTADAVEVVRCKDCGERNEFGRCNCITGRNIYVPVGDDFFCGYGERRADDGK